MSGKNANTIKISHIHIIVALFFACAAIGLYQQARGAVLTSDEEAAPVAAEGQANQSVTTDATAEAAAQEAAGETLPSTTPVPADNNPNPPEDNNPNPPEDNNPNPPDEKPRVDTTYSGGAYPTAGATEDRGVGGEEAPPDNAPAQEPLNSPIESAQPESDTHAVQPQPGDVVITNTISETTGEAGQEIPGEVKKDTRISLDLKGIDIIELLRILSLKTGYTIVPSRDVSGRVNIFLNNITFDDALEIILVSQSLAAEKKNNLIRVMTSTEYKNLYGREYNEKKRLEWVQLQYANPVDVFEVLKQIKSDVGKVIADQTSGVIIMIDTDEKLAEMKENIKALDTPLHTAVFEFNYGKAKDVKTQVENLVSKGPGKVNLDERTNKLVVSDLPERITDIRKAVTAFDDETREVFIEAEIVQIILNREFRRGIDWEVLRDKLDTMDLTADFSTTFTGSSMEVSVGAVATNKYNAVLQLLKTYGDTKVLSHPKLAVVNNEEAKILVGTKDVYVTQTLSQGESTTVTSESIEFIDVGVKLTVVPTINKEGFVTMKIKPEVSTVTNEIETQLGSRIPIVETTESETVVKIKDGNTIIIGGLMKEEKTDTTTGFPILSKIPVLGALFGNKYTQNRNSETIVFITPHIISGSAEKERIEKELKPSSMVETADAAALKEKAKPLQDTEIEVSQATHTKKRIVPKAPERAIAPKGVIALEDN